MSNTLPPLFREAVFFVAQLGAGSMAAVAETQNSLAGLQKWVQDKAMKPANAGVFTDENARNLQVQSTQQAFFYSVWQRQSRLRAFGMVCSLLCARLNALTKCLRHYVERGCGMFSSAKLHFAMESSPPDRKSRSIRIQSEDLRTLRRLPEGLIAEMRPFPNRVHDLAGVDAPPRCCRLPHRNVGPPWFVR